MNEFDSMFQYHRNSEIKRKKKEEVQTSINRDVYGVLVRVSTDRQVEEGDSIEMQKERAMEIIRKNNGVLHKFYIEEGVSGSKNKIEKRPMLQELLHDIQSGIVNKLVAYKRDRLTRITGDYLRIMDICSDSKCDIVFSSSGETQMLSDPIIGKVVETFLGSISEMESANTSVRVRDTMASIAAKGQWTGGTLPYGYDMNENKEIYVVKEVLPSIIEIEDLYLDGYGIASISRWMNGIKVNSLGVRPQGADKKRVVYKGRVDYWTPKAVQNVLFNPFYAGIIEYSTEGNKWLQKDQSKFIRQRGTHEAIRSIDKQTEIYYMKEKKSVGAPRQYNTSFLLTGILYCANCGQPFHSRTSTRNGKTYSYYCCGGRNNPDVLSRNETCKTRTYKQHILEDCVVAEVINYFEDMNLEKTQEMLEKGANVSQERSVVSMRKIEDKIEDLESDMKGIMRLMKRLDEDDSKYEILISSYEEELSEVVVELNETKKARQELEEKMLDQDIEASHSKKLLKMAKNFAETFTIAPEHAKKALLTSVVDRVELQPNGDMDFQFKFNIKLHSEESFNEENTDEDFIIYNSRGERMGTKIIKNNALQLAIPSVMTVNLYKWLDSVAYKISENISKWIKQISNRITASRLSRESGGKTAVSTFARLLKGESLFSTETFSVLERAYDVTAEDFIEFADLPPISRETLLSKTMQRRGKKYIDYKIEQAEIPYTKEWIIEQIKQTKKELGRTPFYIEMAERGIKHRHFRNHFGGYKQALDEIGLKPTPHQGMRFEVKETKRELIKMYTEFSRKLGRTARRSDLNNSDEIYNYEYFMKVFDNLDELKRAAAKRGVPNPHSRNYTEDEIMDKLIQLYNKKGSRLIRDEVAPHLNVVTVKNYLGVSKWKEVMEKVEEEIERRNNIED